MAVQQPWQVGTGLGRRVNETRGCKLSRAAAREASAAAAVKHDVIPCIHTGSGGMAKEYLAKGWRLTTIQNDMRLMLAGAADALKAARS